MGIIGYRLSGRVAWFLAKYLHNLIEAEIKNEDVLDAAVARLFRIARLRDLRPVIRRAPGIALNPHGILTDV